MLKTFKVLYTKIIKVAKLKIILILSLLFITTILSSDTKEQTKYMQHIADKTNAKVEKLKDLPRSTTHISHIEVEEDYTLSILFETNFTDKRKAENFKIINEIKMKQKFCRDNFYKRMQDGFKIKFSYYTPQNELIAYFMLDKESCEEANQIYSSIRFNHE